MANEIDRLEIAVEAEASKANKALAAMEKQLNSIADDIGKVVSLTSAIDGFGKFDTSGFEKVQKEIDGIINSSKKANKTTASPRINRSDIKYATKSLGDLYDKFKKAGTGLDVSKMGLSELNSGLKSSETALKRWKSALEKKIAIEGTEKIGKQFESNTYEIQKATNEIEIYKKAISSLENKVPDFTITRNGNAYIPNDFPDMDDTSISNLLKKYEDLGKDVELPDFKNKEEVLSFIEKYESEMDRALNTAKKATTSVDLDNAIREFSVYSNYVEKARDAYSDFVRLPGVDSSKTEEATKKLYTYDALIREVKSDLSELANKGLGEGDAEYDEKVRLLKQLQIEQKRYNKEQEDTVKSELGLKKTNNEIKSMQKNLKSASNAISSFGKKAKSALSSAIKSASKLKNAIFGVQKQSNKGMSWGRMIGSSVLFSFVFQGISAIQNAIKEGSDNLAQYSSEYNNSLSSMVTSLLYLKNAWAAAFSPIANVVAPYISAFIDMIASALNSVGQFLSALTGKGFAVQAKKVWKDYASGLTDAKDEADKAKDSVKDLENYTLGIDELNILQPNDTSGSGSGSGGSGSGAGEISPSDMFTTVETTGAISDFARQIREAFLAEDWEGLGDILAGEVNKGLQKLYNVLSWSNVGKKVAPFINAFTTSFNSLVDSVNWDLMGNTVGTGINTIVNTANLFISRINWKNLGKSFGTGIMGIVDEVNWNNLGTLFGNKFMIAWNILLGLVTTLDWKRIGKSLADGFNSIVESIDLGDVGKTIGLFVSGVIDAVREFVKNADWDAVGREISEGLSNAFKYASDDGKNTKLLVGIISAIISAASVKGIIGAITNISNLSKSISKLKTAMNGMKGGVFTKVISNFKKLGSAVKNLPSNLKNIKNLFNGNFFGNLNTQISNIRNKMTGLQKGVLSTVAVFGEFSLLKDAFSDLIIGTDNVSGSIAKIAVGASAASAALYVAFGPAGIAVGAVTALISAFVGVNDAMNDIATNSMFETLETTGVVTLQELGNVAKDSFSQITQGVDVTIEKLNSIQSTRDSINSTTSNIDQLRAAIDNGAYSASEKVPEIISQFQSLLDNTKQIFDEEYNVIVGNVVGAWADILEAQGQSVPEVVAQLASLRDEGTTAYSELETSIEDLIEQYQNGSISADDFYKKSQPLFDELKTLNSDGEIDETTTAIKNLGGALDLSQYVDGDSFDTTGFQTYMDEVIDTATTGKDNLKTLGEENADTIAAFKDQLDQLGADTSKIDWASLYGASDEQVSKGISDIDSAYQDYADQIQYNLLSQLPSVVEDATKDYDKLNPIKKIFTSEEKYVNNAIDSWKENVLSPISDSLEDGFEQLGIDGEVWAVDASEKLVSSIFDSITTYTSNSMPITTETLKENWKTILNDSLQGAAEAVDAESYGKDTVDGYNSGVSKNAESSYEKIKEWMDGIDKSIHDSSMKFGSPSKTAEQYGADTITGYNNGIINNIASTKSTISSYMDSVKSAIESKSNTMGDSMSESFRDSWKDIKSVLSEAPDFFDDTFSESYSYVKSSFEFMDSWFSEKWAETKNVFKDVKTYFKSGFQSAYDSVKNIWSGLGSFFKSVAQNAFNPIEKLVNGIIKGVNWVLKEVDSNTRVSEWGGVAFAKGSAGIPQDTFGMVNDQKGSTYKELIVPPNGKAFIPNGRNVMLPLQKGTKIMPARQTKEFMRSIKIPKFAKGKGFTGDVMDYLQDPDGITQIAFDKYADTSRLSGVWKSIASGILNTVFVSVSDFIGNEFEKVVPKVDYNPSAGVEQWRQLASYALRLTGQYNEANLNRILMQMQTESGGNPNAINDWDINAKNGTPSKGLMQVIDPTFKKWALDGYDTNIWDPLSNMIAAIRYTLNRYGSLANGWKGHGYANGGFPSMGEVFLARERGPELVGRIGSRNAVANNNQIVEAVSRGVENSFDRGTALLLNKMEDIIEYQQKLLDKNTSANIDGKKADKMLSKARRNTGYSFSTT